MNVSFLLEKEPSIIQTYKNLNIGTKLEYYIKCKDKPTLNESDGDEKQK